METFELMPLVLELLDRTANTQLRAKMDPATITDYARRIQEKQLDLDRYPIDVVYDGATYRIADGWYRFEAVTELGYDSIPCRIRKGSEEDARIFAARANHGHGLTRTDADKRCAVEAMLSTKAWSKKSSREIAEHCGVSHPFVEKVRKEIAETTGNVSSSTPREGKDGKVRKKPTPKAGPSASKSESNGEPQPEVEGFSTPAPAVATKPTRNGTEKITPEQRKAAKAAFGVLVRFVGMIDEPTIAESLEEMAEALKEHWG